MRSIALVVSVLVTVPAAATPAAAQSRLSAEDVLSRLVGDQPSQQRDAWYGANAKGKPVAWVAPVFNVHNFGLMIVNMRATERGLVACGLPRRLEAAAKKVEKGDTVLCVGRIDDYERMMGAALVNVAADDFIVGKEKIDAWEKTQSRSKP